MNVYFDVCFSRQSSPPTPDTSDISLFSHMTEASIVTDLANFSGSDEDLGAEAKRIRQKHLQERRKLKELGTLIPIGTEKDEIDAAASNSQATALPLRTKHGQSE